MLGLCQPVIDVLLGAGVFEGVRPNELSSLQGGLDVRRRRTRIAWRGEVGCVVGEDGIDHSRTKTKSPQTNGIVERFHKTVLDEFYRIAFRKKIYGSIADLQVDLDRWVQSYNEERPHQGRWCFGKTPMQTFLDATPLAREKMIAA